MRFRLMLLMCCAALALPWRAEAARPTPTPTPATLGSIEGSVTTGPYQFHPEGDPLAGWDVLLGRDCTLITKTKTDAQGLYRFDGLEPGRYVVQLSNHQPGGQAWRFTESSTSRRCDDEALRAEAVAGKVAAGPDFRIEMVSPPRGFFGKVFNDLNENGVRDSGEPHIQLSLRWNEEDIVHTYATDMEGNFRAVDERREFPGEPPPRPFQPTSCPARPELPTGYRITTPRPGPCGRNGCVTNVVAELYQCQDFGVHLVDEQGATFGGGIWRNAAPAAVGSLVQARVGGTICGEDYVSGGAAGSRAWYEIIVLSAQARAGCGTDGAEVRFYLDGEPINTIGYWRTGDQSLDMFVGPPAAVFDGSIRRGYSSDGSWGHEVVRGYIGDVQCGEAVASVGHLVPYPGFTLAVLPDSLRPGCGRPGDIVRFTVDGRPALETALWGEGIRPLSLTLPGLEAPDTGSWGEHPDGDRGSLAAALMLLALGLTLSLGGMALRRD